MSLDAVAEPLPTCTATVLEPTSTAVPMSTPSSLRAMPFGSPLADHAREDVPAPPVAISRKLYSWPTMAGGAARETMVRGSSGLATHSVRGLDAVSLPEVTRAVKFWHSGITGRPKSSPLAGTRPRPWGSRPLVISQV